MEISHQQSSAVGVGPWEHQSVDLSYLTTGYIIEKRKSLKVGHRLEFDVNNHPTGTKIHEGRSLDLLSLSPRWSVSSQGHRLRDRVRGRVSVCCASALGWAELHLSASINNTLAFI